MEAETHQPWSTADEDKSHYEWFVCNLWKHMTRLMSLMDSRSLRSSEVMSPQTLPFSLDKHPLSPLLGPQAPQSNLHQEEEKQTHWFYLHKSNMAILTKSKGGILMILLFYDYLTHPASKWSWFCIQSKIKNCLPNSDQILFLLLLSTTLYDRISDLYLTTINFSQQTDQWYPLVKVLSTAMLYTIRFCLNIGLIGLFNYN